MAKQPRQYLKRKGRLPEINRQHKVRPLAQRVKSLELDPDQYRSEAARKRNEMYQSPAWAALRRAQLATPECRKCFFCGAWANTLEHLVGHGSDAEDVAALLRLPPIKPTWEERFWEGPFVGSCSRCARSRSGSERMGRLHAWTAKWLEHRRGGDSS